MSNPSDFGSKPARLRIHSPDRSRYAPPADRIGAHGPSADQQPQRADDLAHELQVEIITGRIPSAPACARKTWRRGSASAARRSARRCASSRRSGWSTSSATAARWYGRSSRTSAATSSSSARARGPGRGARRRPADQLRQRRPGGRPGAAARRRRAPHAAAGDARRRGRITLEQCSQANELFHNVILAAANCPPLRDTVQSLANRCRGRWPGTVRRRPGHRAAQRRRPRPDHRGARTRRTAQRARRLLQEHVMDTGETLARWLSRQGGR